MAVPSADEMLRWMRVGVLAALALMLGYLETFIPIPIPGVKLGLANVAILLSFLRLDARAAFFVMLVKVLAQGLLFGSPLTLAFSLAGSLLAYCLMAALAKIPSMHPVMVSVCGAVAHTAGQMLVAAALLGTRLVWFAAPLLMASSIGAGALCGVLTVRLDRALSTGDHADGEALPPLGLPPLPSSPGKPVGALLAGYLVFTVAILLQGELMPLAVLSACAAAACAVARVPGGTLWRAARAFAVLLLVGAAASIAGNRQGAELVSLGPIPITAEALSGVAVIALRLGAAMGMSVAVMGLIGQRDLIAFTVRSAERLARCGLDTQGPLIALNVCLETLPLLAAGIGGGGARLSTGTFVGTIASAYARAELLARAFCKAAGEGACDDLAP